MVVRFLGLTFLVLLLFQIIQVKCVYKRSIDLIAAHSLISDTRLPREVTPNSYVLDLHPFPEDGTFKGRVRINITWQETSDRITLHAYEDLVINHSDVGIVQHVPDDETTFREKESSTPHTSIDIKILKSEKVPKKPLFIIYLDKSLNRGTQCEIDISFSGKLYNDTSEGLFRSSYVDSNTGERKWFVASMFRPNLARRVFPCFDEPAYKVPFTVSIVRPKSMTALSNMPLVRSEELEKNSKYIRDYFQESPPMSTFTLGFVVSDFVSVAYNKTSDKDDLDVDLRIWSRPDFLSAVQNATEKVYKSLKSLQKFWGLPYPLPKLNCIALPNYQGTRPADNWGLIIFKESELSNKGSWQITHELVYQWLGSLATPFWWSDAHINNALASYTATYTTLKLQDGMFQNWPMTMLYSIYYEFSKRYPHGKVMAIKQETASTKTELLFRMLNYTLGEKTLVHGLQRFMSDRQFKTFFGDDIWGAITEQARFDSTLEDTITVNEIAASWITKDRLPVLNVTRNYDDKTATVSQRVYLRERPHDVPDQEKFLWWIPVVLVDQRKLNFTNSTPITWMKRQREIKINGLPEANQFIVVNPEEIGPFPVNYDTRNWNLLVDYLQNNEGRLKIPVTTRAKLLHDAWNLAYAGDLNFGTALNMTLFLKYERDHLVWYSVFTMIDHIGRHISGSVVYKDFLRYVRTLLTPLYEELGEPQEGESEEKGNLRSSSKVFLCRAGYRPCIEEAQSAFEKWRNSENPDEGNPVANQYICPVFKWGTREEWLFGLQRVMNFPSSRKQSERTYLLKTLAGCPVDSWKIERILNITIFEKNGNFSDNDIYLIFSMLTGDSSGYSNLFQYLKQNWDALKKAFENKPQLWSSLISSSTSLFKTKECLDMVQEFYEEKKGQFGPSEFVIEKALKRVKEEVQWSNDNLPVIKEWLDNHFLKNKQEGEEQKFFSIP